jgi:beta-phosphoglucomutase-like phosphatase (HAD superfamily)
VKPGLPELIALLRRHRLPIAVATSTDSTEANLSLTAAGLSISTFDAFVTGDQVTRGKPNPEIYVTAAGRLAVDPASCVALDDSSPGTLAATRAGMTTFLIPDGQRRPSAEAMRAAYRVVPSLMDVTAWLSALLSANAPPVPDTRSSGRDSA